MANTTDPTDPMVKFFVFAGYWKHGQQAPSTTKDLSEPFFNHGTSHNANLVTVPVTTGYNTHLVYFYACAVPLSSLRKCDGYTQAVPAYLANETQAVLRSALTDIVDPKQCRYYETGHFAYYKFLNF